MIKKILSGGLLAGGLVLLFLTWNRAATFQPRLPRLSATDFQEHPESEELVWEADPSFDADALDEALAPPLGMQATALNNEAVQLAAARRYEEAVRRFHEALNLEPDHPTLLRNLQATLFNWGTSELNEGDVGNAIGLLEESLLAGVSVETMKALGSAYLHAGEPEEAAAVLEEASEIAPSNAQVLVLLAQSYIDLDRRVEALELLFAARDANAPEAVVGPMIETLSREVDAEWDFAVEETSHFRLSFGDEEAPGTIDTVADALERAYRDVGGKLGTYPPDKTPVVLYARRDFHNLTGTSGWAEGVFDGRIKIPVRGLTADDPQLDRVLRHEYTHSVVARLGGRRVPAWVNEGLAMWAEEENDGDRLHWAEDTIAQTGTVPLRNLTGSFARLPAAHAQLAYAQSYLAVRALVEQYGTGRVRQLLEEISRRRPLEDAFFDVYRRDLERFERDVFGS